ncbi:hypothetical protein [Micromonospora olivasterospora]|uniref:hypothetical protein n=1 Tax=Micromonospora olivasterospora TaxID=1880 RepID=UPI0011A5E1F2|nr:hypothetical protein [Micromonospora olivasterospora]
MQRVVGDFLNGELTTNPESRRYRGRLDFFVAWQPPALPLKLNPVWRGQANTGVLFQRVSCPSS